MKYLIESNLILPQESGQVEGNQPLFIFWRIPIGYKIIITPIRRG